MLHQSARSAQIAVRAEPTGLRLSGRRGGACSTTRHRPVDRLEPGQEHSQGANRTCRRCRAGSQRAIGAGEEFEAR